VIKMSKTNTEFVNHVQAQLGLPYWWGTFGAVCSEALWQQKAKQYPTMYTAVRYKVAKANHFGKRTYDCAGLVKSYMFQDTPTSAPKYDVKYDKNVSGLISACSKTGGISSMPEIPGLLVFRGTAHVGIYIGKGYVIEAKGFDFGVVKTKLADGKWDKWGQLSWITYVPAEKPAVKPTAKPTAAATSKDKKEGAFDMMKEFKNTSGKELAIYADSALKDKVGTLFAGSSCNCIGQIDGKAILLYSVSGTSVKKVGFTNYIKGVQ